MPSGWVGPFWRGAVLGTVFLGGAWAVARGGGIGFPVFRQAHMESFAVEDVSMVMNGARRLGADIAFIQLMQYYGSPENAHPSPTPPKRSVFSHSHDDSSGHEGHAHWHLGEENNPDPHVPSHAFPQLIDYTLRGAELDPRFHYFFLFSAGALAFNLNRGEEALTILERGMQGDPTYWRYRLYAGAFAYRKNEQTDRVIARLEQALEDPECPSMIKNILGNIYIKTGRLQRASEIYEDLLNSRDKEYAALAREKLKRFRSESPR